MQTSLKHRDLTKKTIGIFYDVYNELGHGFIESIYHKAFLIALEEAEIETETKVDLQVTFRGQQIGSFEADLIVEKSVMLELKATRALTRTNEVHLRNYLRATTIEVGLLLNFGQEPQFKRMVFGNERKRNSPKSSLEALLEKE